MRKAKPVRAAVRRRSMPDLFPAPVAGAAAQSVEISVFADQKSRANTNTGHGEMAEEAITLLDNLLGSDAEVTGRDNAKDGPDRRVGDTYIQTKYYRTARESMEACFDDETGLYRYIRDGEPMQLEVPADQYDRVVTLFAGKIESGLVPGVTDPAQAAEIVRAGRLTYQQSVALTEPFTAESVAYDAATGALVSLCVTAVSFAAAAFTTLWRTRSVKKALRAGVKTGLQGAGRAFGQHLLISQLARTELAASMLPAAEEIVDPIAGGTVNAIVNALRGLSGKAAVAGATAEKQLARMLRTGVLTSAVIFLLLTLPDIIRLVLRKQSPGQFFRRLCCRAASLAGGTLGAVLAGMLLGGSAALGTFIAVGGAFLGGTLFSCAVNALFGLFHEDDTARAVRMINEAVSGCSTEQLAALKAHVRRIPTRELRRMAGNPQLLRSVLPQSAEAPHEFSLQMPDIG